MRTFAKLPVLRLLAVMFVAWFACGCSSAIRGRGPKVYRYSSNRDFSREVVLKELGTPESSTTFRNARTAAVLKAQGNPAFADYTGRSSVRVAVVDRYIFKGPVLDNAAFKDSYGMGGFAVMTLGLSELIFLPIAIVDAISTAGSVHHFYMAYSPANALVAYRLIKVH